MQAALKIAALLSYCGGPLFIADLLKPRIGLNLAYVITFFPVGLMLVGALCLDNDPRSRASRAAVWVGCLGLTLALGMHVYAVGCFVNGVRTGDQALHYIGIVIGVAWSVVYLRATRRWPAVSSSSPEIATATEPIEPS